MAPEQRGEDVLLRDPRTVGLSSKPIAGAEVVDRELPARAMLIKLACERGQGHLFGASIPADGLEASVLSRRSDASC